MINPKEIEVRIAQLSEQVQKNRDKSIESKTKLESAEKNLADTIEEIKSLGIDDPTTLESEIEKSGKDIEDHINSIEEIIKRWEGIE